MLSALLLAVITEITPPAPTAATPVSITITSEPGSPCAPTLGSVTRTGKSVRLDLVPYTGPCILVIAPWKATYELGTFPIGDYTLDVHLGGKPYVATTFVVRNPNPTFTIKPFAHVSRPAGPPTDPGVLARIDGVNWAALCTFGLCPNVKVLFGDVAVQPKVEAGGFMVRVPPHPPGLVDVKIVADDRPLTYTSAGAVYFYDRSAPPDLTVWSRVLFPVLDSNPGAFGAQWITDAVIFNGNDYTVEGFNRVDPYLCVDWGCERLDARSYFAFEGSKYPRGAALLLPRESVDAFSFASRVRDRSREGSDFGAEVPVLKESAMRRTPFRLLDVPIAGGYRSKLRIYVYTNVDGQNVAFDGWTPSVEHFIQQAVPLQRIDQTLTFAEIDLNAIAGAKSDRVMLQVTPPNGQPTWAFVTVTNNSTQRVTLVTPN